MSAAEMREAAARLCDGYRGDARVAAYDARAQAADDMCETLAAAIRALPLPGEEGVVERVARALLVSEREAYANSPELLDEHFEWWRAGKDNPDSCVHYSSIGIAVRKARAAIRAINKSEP